MAGVMSLEASKEAGQSSAVVS
eukprot:COSAG01_NODE_51174_length_357_cov_0.395349_1_plen_21_part_10